MDDAAHCWFAKIKKASFLPQHTEPPLGQFFSVACRKSIGCLLAEGQIFGKNEAQEPGPEDPGEHIDYLKLTVTFSAIQQPQVTFCPALTPLMNPSSCSGLALVYLEMRVLASAATSESMDLA